MKFTLKDYQEEAVQKVLENLKKASKRWREDKDKHAFSLTATTGAGKTVMAAAVFEALFHGDDNYDIEPDPGAVVIWFSDDPSLNDQSRSRLIQASDRLSISDLVVVENTFQREKFEAGKVYFLNTQKLGKSSLLVRGHDVDEEGYEKTGQRRLPDARSYTIWDTIQNTIDDPALTLYLVLDEAHRGMKAAPGAGEKSTIVKRLINGQGGVPGIPVVWGISATVARFEAAIQEMQDRIKMPPVLVDAAKVQASGLLKDTIILDVPKDAGQFDTVLIRRGTDKLKDISAAWAVYAQEQGAADPVRPLMVVQVPNTPDAEQVSRALDTVFERWPDLTEDAIAHVFGDHSEQVFGTYRVRYIQPQRVQEETSVRVLLAKDAISTGWDCPRAEVMVSFRAATDETHITQLLGRMVRSPLAMRIPGNERLNSVDCLLPFFNEASVTRIASALTSGGEGEEKLSGRRILINPVDLVQNPAMPDEVWQILAKIPSQSLPKKHARPVKRLTSLAHELAADALLPDGGKKAHSELHRVLDGVLARYADEIKSARSKVLQVEGRTIKAKMGGAGMSFDDFLEEADFAAIDDAFRRAGRAISPDVATTYARYLADKSGEADLIVALSEARIVIASMGLVPETKSTIEDEAEKLAKAWLTQHRVSISGLNHERQEVYRQIRELSAEPMDVDLAVPTSGVQPTIAREEDGSETPLPLFDHHILCDANGKYPAEFNSWESLVVDTELGRPGSVGWYRNPSRGTQESLAIAYQEDSVAKLMRPDFLFFSTKADGSVAVDIVDPHGTHFGDAIPKVKGLAAYAARYGDLFRRIETVAKIGEKFRVLDLKDPATRNAVGKATSIKAIFDGPEAFDYTSGP